MCIKKTVFLILFYNMLSAQEGEELHAIKHKYDPLYRVNYFDKMIFKVDVNSDIDNFYIRTINANNNNSNNSFIPNQLLKLRFSFDYKFLGIYFSTSPGFLPGNGDASNKGKTKTLDLSFNFFYSDRLRQEVVYKRVRGFYFGPNNHATPIDVFPELEINTFGGKTFYILNNNFSYRAFENMTERQLKSAGSFMPSISYYFHDLTTNEKKIGKNQLTEIKSFDGFFQMGYMYNFVIGRKWYASLGLHPGIGVNWSKNFYSPPNESDNFEIKTVNFNITTNTSIGYNNKNFFSGIKYFYSNYDFSKNNTVELINSKSRFEVFLGYRFKETKTLKKAFDSVDNLLNKI